MCSIVDAAHLALVELEGDIANSLRTSETSKQPSIRLLSSQPQVSWGMRPQLLEFLAQAQAALELFPDTLHLAVSILDRYMSRRIVYARHYQLLGCVCLWLAAKTVDDKHHVPTSGTLSYLCANTYSESMFSEMELHVLSTLDWSILAPTAYDFVDLSVGDVARQLGGELFGPEEYSMVRSMARYACECALFVKETLAMKPSEIAASSVALATTVVDVLESRAWTPVYPQDSTKECFDALVALMVNPPPECAVRYSTDEQCCASTLFVEFYAALSTSTRHESLAEMHSSGVYDGEPCTPVRSRQVSIDSYGTISPLDEEFTTPEGNSESPATYFVPLTPDDVCGYSTNNIFDAPRQK